MLFSTNSIAAKALLSLLALGLAGGAGVGVKKLRDHAQEAEKGKETTSPKRGIELPGIYRWLEVGEDKSQDKDKWEEKLKNYETKQATSDVLSLGEKKGVNGIKDACLSFRNGTFEESVLETKQNQAKEWCSVKKTVEEYLSSLKDKFLSLENNKDENEWKAKFKEYKEKKSEQQNDFNVAEWNESDENNSIKKMKEECKKLKEKEVTDDKKNVNTFENWCMKKDNPDAIKPGQ